MKCRIAIFGVGKGVGGAIEFRLTLDAGLAVDSLVLELLTIHGDYEDGI